LREWLGLVVKHIGKWNRMAPVKDGAAHEAPLEHEVCVRDADRLKLLFRSYKAPPLKRGDQPRPVRHAAGIPEPARPDPGGVAGPRAGGGRARNKGWITAALGDCLHRRGAAWALPNQAWMPSPLSVVQRLDAVTGPFAYVRLLGDREAVDALTPTPDHVVIDRGGQVAAAAKAIWLLRQAPEGGASAEQLARARARCQLVCSGVLAPELPTPPVDNFESRAV
jgi:hypothetical protein